MPSGRARRRKLRATPRPPTSLRRRSPKPWQQRAAAASRAAEERRAAYGPYVNDHLEALLAELAPEAEAAVAAIQEAARALDAAFERYWRSAMRARL